MKSLILYLRSVLFTVLLLVWTLFLAVFSPPTLLLPRQWAYDYTRFWAHGVLLLLRVVCGLRHQVRGRGHVPDTPVIYALKHQSAWETIAMLTLVPRFAAVLKRELLHIPIYGWYMHKIGMVPIDRRGGGRALRDMVASARGYIEEGRSIVIMPEGTRMAPGRTGRYHPGVAALYKQLGVPVVPVALNSGMFWGRRSFLKRAGTITIEFLEPIPAGLDRATFMATLEERIEPAARRLYEDARAAYFPDLPPVTPPPEDDRTAA